MDGPFLFLNGFFKFIKHPIDRRVNHKHFFKDLIFGFLALDITILLPTILIVSFVSDALNIDPSSKFDVLFDSEPIILAVSAIILAPLLEELIFRFFIRLKYAFFYVYPIILVGRMLKIHHICLYKWMITSWSTVFPVIFFGSSLLFGFVHIFNFESAEEFLPYFPILTLPQIFLGLIFGYTRIAYGLKYSILFHAIHNGVLILPLTIYYLVK